MSDTIDNIPTMGAILAYCREKRQSCWVVHVRPEFAHLPYPGTSAELLNLTHSEAHLRIANGDEYWVPASQIHMRVEHAAPKPVDTEAGVRALSERLGRALGL